MTPPSEKSLFRGIGVFAALAVGGLVVVVLAAVGMGIGGRGGEEGSAPPATTASTAVTTNIPPTTTTPVTTSRPATEASGASDAISTRDVALLEWGPNYVLNPPFVDTLAAQTVLRVTAGGFEPYGRGIIEQCTVAGCANQFPVVFDVNGAAQVQYLVNDSFARELDAESTCRADAPPCTVHLRNNENHAFLTTVFHDPAPKARQVAVETSEGEFADGAPVQISVVGFVPGERVQAMLCAAPYTHGTERCGAPGPVAPFTIDANGTGRVAMVVKGGRVGSEGSACGRSAPCAIVVSYPRSSVPGTVFPIDFANGPSASYDAARFLIGMAAALVLVLLAVYLVRTTDWRKPSEADTPDLDRAVLLD